MTNNTALFAFEHQRVRTVFVLGVVWFVAADVCKVLGIENVGNAIARLDEDERDDIHIMDAIGRQQSSAIISESGVFRLIFTSRKPEAEEFRRWLARDVLPMIRRYGYYAPRRKPMSQSKMMIEGKVFFVEEFEQRRPDGAAAVSERAMCAALGDKIVTEHPEWLAPIAAWAAHNWYHAWARDEAKATKEHDPDQPELWSHYSVLRDGRERWVPRETLSRGEARVFLTRGARMREAWRNLVDRLLRHDRALLADFNARNETPLDDNEVRSIAPDLAP